jgi:DNA-directed RNA polymerase subunit beta
MPIPATRIIQPTDVRNFGRFGDAVDVPDLTDVQTRSYDRFLQLDVSYDKRTTTGFEGVLKEIFPIESYDKTISLEYIRLRARASPRLRRRRVPQLRLTYGRPFRVVAAPQEDRGEPGRGRRCYLGDMPIMIVGGEFIINGAERVVGARSCTVAPGVRLRRQREADKDLALRAASSPSAARGSRSTPQEGHARRPHRPERQVLGVTLLARDGPVVHRAPRSIIKEFFGAAIEAVDVRAAGARLKLIGDPETNVMPYIACEDVIDPETGEVYLDAGKPFTSEKFDKVSASAINGIQAMPYPKDPIILNAIHEDVGPAGDSKDSHEGALLKIYQRLRPGNPPQLEKAKELFKEKFQDANRYRLGRSGGSASTGSSTRRSPRRR